MRSILAAIMIVSANLLIEVKSRPSLSSYSEPPSIYEICTKSDLLQIEELKVHMFENLKNFSKESKHSTSFGLLEEDWRRLRLLETRLPEDSILKGKLVRAFRILVSALHQAHGMDLQRSRENEYSSSFAVEEMISSREDFQIEESKKNVFITSKDDVEKSVGLARPSNTPTSKSSSFLNEDSETTSNDPLLNSIFSTPVPLSSAIVVNSIETAKPSLNDHFDEDKIKFVNAFEDVNENTKFSEENTTDSIINYSNSRESSTLGIVFETSLSNSIETNVEIDSEIKTSINDENKTSFVSEETHNSNSLSDYEEEEKYPVPTGNTHFSGEDAVSIPKISSENVNAPPYIINNATDSTYITNSSFPNIDDFVVPRNLSLHPSTLSSTENLLEPLPSTNAFETFYSLLFPVQSETHYSSEDTIGSGSSNNPSYDFSLEKSDEFQEKPININVNSNTDTNVESEESTNTESDIDHRFFESETTINFFTSINNDRNSLEDRVATSNRSTITATTREELDMNDSSILSSQESSTGSVHTTGKTSFETTRNVHIEENNNSNKGYLSSEYENVEAESHTKDMYLMPTYSTPDVINANRSLVTEKGTSLTTSSAVSSLNLEEIESTESEKNNALDIKTSVVISKENYEGSNTEDESENDTFSIDGTPTNTPSTDSNLDVDRNLIFEEAPNLSIALIKNASLINGNNIDKLQSLEDSAESTINEQSRDLSFGVGKSLSELITSLDSKESNEKSFAHNSSPEVLKEIPRLFESTTATPKKDESVSEETQPTAGGENDLFRPNTELHNEKVLSSAETKSMEENYEEKGDGYSLYDSVLVPLESIVHEDKYELDSIHDKHSTRDTETTKTLENSSNAPDTESFVEKNSEESFRTFTINIPRSSENSLSTNTYPPLEILKQNEYLDKFFSPSLSQDCNNGNNCVVVKNIEFSPDSGSTLSTTLRKYYDWSSKAYDTSEGEENISNLGNYYT